MILNIVRWTFWVLLVKPLSYVNPFFLSKISAVLAFISYHALKNRRIPISEELHKIYKERCSSEVIHRYVRKSFDVYINGQTKLFYLSRMNPSNIDKFTRISGLAILDNALRNDSGAILLNPHYGVFLLVMAALGHRGFSVNQLAIIGEPVGRKRRGFQKKIYDAKFNQIERKLPARFINAAERRFALREAIQALNRNEIVIFASTGRAGRSWHTVPFMNRNASFNIAPYKLAFKTKAPLIPVFAIDCGPAPIVHIAIEQPIEIHASDTPATILERYVRLLEKYVDNRPDHFASFIYEMHQKAGWDDHPFFDDYGVAVMPPDAKNHAAKN